MSSPPSRPTRRRCCSPAAPAPPRRIAAPIVCACFDVGVNTIVAAIARGEATSVESIGALLKAGSNCGSCRPELKGLLAGHAPRIAAE